MKLLFRLIISFLLISTLGLILGLGFHQFRGLTEGVPAPVLIQQGTQLLETGNSESALETWQRAEQYYRAQNDLVGILGSQLNQAKALEELGFYPRSCQTILKSLGQENSNCGELKNEDITQILESIKLDYRNQISQENELIKIKLIALHNLGNTFEQAEKLGNLRLISHAKGTLGELLNKTDLLKDALKIAQNINATEILYRWQWQLGKLLRASDPETALDFYEAAFNTLQVLRAEVVNLIFIITPIEFLEQMQKNI